MPCVMSVSSNIPGRLSPGVTDWVCSGAGATAGHLIWSSARVLLSRGAAHAQTSPGPEGGGAQSVRASRQTGNGLLNIIWNVDMIQTRGNSGGRSERPGTGDTVTSVWPGWGERGDQYGHWWWWTVIHGQSGGVEIVPVIPAKIVNKWTHKHGVWVTLPQIRLRLGRLVTGQGVLVEIERLNSGQWLEGTENFCQE